MAVWKVTPGEGVAEKRVGLVGEGVDIYHTSTTHFENHCPGNRPCRIIMSGRSSRRQAHTVVRTEARKFDGGNI